MARGFILGLAAMVQRTDTALADLPDSRLRQLVDYWRARRGERMAPPRAALDPVDIPDLLPWLAIFDVTDHGFHTRLAGTGLEGICGRTLTGLVLDHESAHPLELTLFSWLRQSCDQRAPMLVQATLAGPRTRLVLQGVMLPLSGDGDHIDKLICGCVALGGLPLPGAGRRVGMAPPTLVEFSAHRLEV
ncbi:PAS domain-containing protein [Niveispirillum sp. SYP-B3756]|nr:PAS domain-containing protein [Niveispirillum sp. SYP-B3756]